MQQIEKKSWFSKYKLEITDVKGNLLSKSLLWMGLGLSIIILFAWLCSSIPTLLNYTINFTLNRGWIWILILNVAIIFSLFYTINNHKIPIIIPIILYTFFSIYEGFFITTILVLTNTSNIMKDLIIFMLIPAGIFGIMGVVSYFNWINFSKLIPFVVFTTFALCIMLFTLVFVYSRWLESIYLFFSGIIFTIWVGIDLQLIIRRQKELPEYTNKKEINRLAFFFGVQLFIDFVRILIIVIEMFRR